MIRGKFVLESVKTVSWNQTGKELAFRAVSNDGTPENDRFHQYTPSGTITMFVDNPAALDEFVLGREFYVDFTLVPK